MVSPRVEDDERSLRKTRSLHSLASAAMPPPVHFKSLKVSEEQLRCIKKKSVRKFYEHQNDMINRFMEVDRVVSELKQGIHGHNDYANALSPVPPPPIMIDEEHALPTGGMDETTRLLDDGRGASQQQQQQEKGTSRPWLIHLAINVSFIANVALFIAKFLLALYSGSMAILASAFESFLDLLSNGIIFITVRMMRNQDWYRYPVGKARMEPLGIIIFSVVITTSFSQVLITSVERLTAGEIETIDLDPLSVAILVSNILVKGVLWLWCRSIKGSSSVQALAQDHENDVVFNIASTVFPVAAVWAKQPWLDPVGAILLSLYIIYEWMVLLVDNIRRMTGHAASVDDLKQLTYMAYRFSSKVQAVDTVRAYYVGDRLLVEVDIVLPPDYPLREAHDIGEALQDALELMDNVERAFVHLDYNQVHAIEHRKKPPLSIGNV